MQNELKVAGLQTDLVWEQPEKNRVHFSEIIDDLEKDIDLIVLPEMFTSGFTMNPESVAETMKGETILWMKEIAKLRNCAVTGSLVIQEKGNYYNRLIFMHPSGKMETYDKRHSFTLAGEHKKYTSGSSHLTIDYKGWKICPFICYDLRFPVWSRNTSNYDLLIFMANWPIKRVNAWDILLKARAIENMSYTIGVNRVGIDANNYEYSGHSVIIDTLGNELAKLPEHKAGVVTTILNKKNQDSVRAHLGFLNDRDNFKILD